MVAADTVPEIQSRLQEIYHELPEAMRRIADTLMADPLLGALWGIESMAERANVSMGTVMRFSKRLGYRGFSDFRDALREACQVRSEGAPLEALEAPTDVFWALSEVARRDQENLNRLLQSVDHAILESATQLLIRSQHRVLLGRGVSHVMGQIMAFNLTQAGLPCIAATPSDFSNQVANLGPKDLLVALGFAPYSRETVDAAAFAKRCGSRSSPSPTGRARRWRSPRTSSSSCRPRTSSSASASPRSPSSRTPSPSPWPRRTPRGR